MSDRLRKGFTLIELLVVIAIIAIIAAILYPVFAKTKAAAKKSIALSNARQIVAGGMMYQTDNDDRFALYFSGYVVNDPSGRFYYDPLMYWPQAISPYIQKVRTTVGQALIQDLPGVFIDPIKGANRQDPGLWPLGNISSWGMSDDIARWQCPPGVEAVKVPVEPSSVVSPADCLLLTETWDVYSPNHDLAGSAFAASFFDASSTATNGATQFLDSPHGASYTKTTANLEPDPKGRNVTAFCDGHVKAVTTGSLTRDGKLWSVGNNGLWP